MRPNTVVGESSDDLPLTMSTETTRVDIRRLRVADSPRLSGWDDEHVRLFAQTESEWPPILVHRQTMRVIDGVHRVRAAAMRGDETIAARFVDGSPSSVFVLAVGENVQHGLPLTQNDRRAAVVRIVGSHPYWSDHAIAAVAGLSAKTVAAIRRRSSPGKGTSGSPADGAAQRGEPRQFAGIVQPRRGVVDHQP